MIERGLDRRYFLAGSALGLLIGCTGRTDPSLPPIEALPGNWETSAALPYAIQEIYPCLHQERIHLGGGLIAIDGEITGATKQHVSWAPGEEEWRAETPLPLELHHPQLVSFKDQLLLIGGFHRWGDATWIMQTFCWRLHEDEWHSAPELPQPNGESVAAVIDGALHLCGGRKPKGKLNTDWNHHTDISDHFVLTGLDAAWERSAPLPTARNSAAAAMLGTNWHVVGGRTVSEGNTAVHEVYDAKEDRWRIAAPMPQGQGGLAAASVGGKLYAFGGEWFNDGGGVYKEAWVYDPASDAWSAIADMPTPRHGLGAVAIEGDIYVIGGAAKAGGNATSDLVEVFTP